LRSVDSESQCRAIEPRNLLLAGATVVDTSGGRAEAPQWPGVLRSYRGPRTGRRDTRVAREPERPCRLRRDCRLGVPAYQLQVDPQLCPELVGRTGDERWYRQAKATKCGEMSGRESERSIVTLRRGNLTEGPRGVKGTPFQLTVGGKHGGCIGTRGRVHETTTDSGSRRLKRGAVCVNCASTDLWGAWVGDHPGLPGGTEERLLCINVSDIGS